MIYRLTVIVNYHNNMKPVIANVETWESEHLTGSMLRKCYNMLYKEAQIGFSNIVQGAIHSIDSDLMRYSLVAGLTAVTFYSTWPDRIARTNIYLNNKYIRTMRGKGK